MDIEIKFPAEVTEAFRQIAAGMQEQREVSKEIRDLVMPLVRVATPVVNEFANGLQAEVDEVRGQAEKAGMDLAHKVLTGHDAEERLKRMPVHLHRVQIGIAGMISFFERHPEMLSPKTNPQFHSLDREAFDNMKEAVFEISEIIKIAQGKD